MRCYISNYIKIREVIKNYLSFIDQLLWAFTALKFRKYLWFPAPTNDEY
jgi:hypothetical protein